ncbi:MAG: class I SAM-dependent methyltransferase [Bacteroidales bacterium]|nr:class I SAM-dependent methyltransferase [Bacteroidales bacterium]
MSFSDFFSKQARRPKGLFGKLIMSLIFNKGNAALNAFTYELMSIQKDDKILEIGFGTGTLINKMAEKIDKGIIEGIDFSNTMMLIAQKKNKEYIKNGKVKLIEANFDEIPLEKDNYTKVCSVNTIYFWKNPENSVKKIVEILKPKGKLVIAFEDKPGKINDNIFNVYLKEEVQNLLIKAGFVGGVTVNSRKKGKEVYHCVVAIK